MHICIYSLLVLVSVIHSNSNDNFTNSINDNNINKNDNKYPQRHGSVVCVLQLQILDIRQ